LDKTFEPAGRGGGDSDGWNAVAADQGRYLMETVPERVVVEEDEHAGLPAGRRAAVAP